MDQPSHGTAPRKLEPHLFGPLTADPVVDTGTHDLFPGEDRLLSGGARKRTRRLLNLLAGPLEVACDDDERILYVCGAQQVPSFMEWFGVGFWFYTLHQVALVFTDRRLIEIMLDLRGRSPRTRYRSYAWSGVAGIKPGFGKLMLQLEDGTNAAWRISVGAERKFIKLLAPRIVEKAVGSDSGKARGEAPYSWLCPKCGANVEPSPESCEACHAEFKTPSMATALAIAIPGGGLFYAGRPVLGTFDLIGELVLFGLFAFGLAVVGTPADAIAVAVAGFFFLVLTKLESVHLSRIFVRRTLPATPASRDLWKKLAIGGGALSATAIVGALLSVGALAPEPARDLTFASPEWSGQPASALGNAAEETPDLRSVWTHADGFVVYVDAYPLGSGERFADVQSEWRATLHRDGLVPTVMDSEIPGDLDGFRCHIEVTDEEGVTVVSFNYVLHDDEDRTVHHVYAYAEPDEAERAQGLLEELVGSATWLTPEVD